MMSEAILSAFIGGVSGAFIALLTSALDKSKIMFEKQFEALSILFSITANIFPNAPSVLGLDYDDAIDRWNCSGTQKELIRFRNKYSAALMRDERDDLDAAIQKLLDAEEVDNPATGPLEKTSEQICWAKEAYDHIMLLEKSLRKNVINQTDLLSRISWTWNEFLKFPESLLRQARQKLCKICHGLCKK